MDSEQTIPDQRGPGDMSLRDFFAAAALVGMGSNALGKHLAWASADLTRVTNEAMMVSVTCYEYADAMLEERLRDRRSDPQMRGISRGRGPCPT